MPRRRVTAWTARSAISSGVIIPSVEPWVRPRPIAKSVATPPGQSVVHRTPRSRSSPSIARMNPTCANFVAQ